MTHEVIKILAFLLDVDTKLQSSLLFYSISVRKLTVTISNLDLLMSCRYWYWGERWEKKSSSNTQAGYLGHLQSQKGLDRESQPPMVQMTPKSWGTVPAHSQDRMTHRQELSLGLDIVKDTVFSYIVALPRQSFLRYKLQAVSIPKFKTGGDWHCFVSDLKDMMRLADIKPSHQLAHPKQVWMNFMNLSRTPPRWCKRS